ncbi:putative movement protein [Olive latent virus 3]|uniref:Putative movement protein n=1 Tax=Olive latent virus 3 TaxID=626962 RepID=C5HGJ2_9VIRU|nr:putative movement protein [Olive latent virus 3]ACN94862.1 putative movement protein [Olive latent virus 3]
MTPSCISPPPRSSTFSNVLLPWRSVSLRSCVPRNQISPTSHSTQNSIASGPSATPSLTNSKGIQPPLIPNLNPLLSGLRSPPSKAQISHSPSPSWSRGARAIHFSSKEGSFHSTRNTPPKPSRPPRLSSSQPPLTSNRISDTAWSQPEFTNLSSFTSEQFGRCELLTLQAMSAPNHPNPSIRGSPRLLGIILPTLHFSPAPIDLEPDTTCTGAPLTASWAGFELTSSPFSRPRPPLPPLVSPPALFSLAGLFGCVLTLSNSLTDGSSNPHFRATFHSSCPRLSNPRLLSSKPNFFPAMPHPASSPNSSTPSSRKPPSCDLSSQMLQFPPGLGPSVLPALPYQSSPCPSDDSWDPTHLKPSLTSTSLTSTPSLGNSSWSRGPSSPILSLSPPIVNPFHRPAQTPPLLPP